MPCVPVAVPHVRHRPLPRPLPRRLARQAFSALRDSVADIQAGVKLLITQHTETAAGMQADMQAAGLLMQAELAQNQP